MGVLVAHLADTHLGYRQYGLYEREVDLYRMFNLLIDKILEEKPDLVIHAGDFFDSYRPPPQAIRVAYKALRKLRDANIPVVAVLGDHDLPKRRGEHPLTLLEELGLVKVVGLEERMIITIKSRSGREVVVAGLPHHKKVAVEKLKARLMRLNNPPDAGARILVLHQCLEGFCPEPELSINELPRGFDYYALGHVHKPQTFRAHGVVGAYPGSIDALRVDEVQYQHGFVFADVERGFVDIWFESLEPIRKQLVYEVDYESLDKMLRSIANEVKQLKEKPIVHLRVRGRNIDKTRVYKLIQHLLENLVLHFRISFHEITDEHIISKNVLERGIDRFMLLKKLLGGDEQLAEFADKLIEIVAEGARDTEIEQLAKQLFKERYGGE